MPHSELDLSQIEALITANKKRLPIKKAHQEVAPLRGNSRSLLRQGKIKYAAVLLLLFPNKGTVSTIFIHRATYRGVHSNQIAFPGGKREKQDKDDFHTALRETEEELGIPAEDVRKIARLSPIYIPVSNFQITPFIGVLNKKPSVIPDKREVSDYLIAPMEAFLQVDAIEEKEVNAGNGIFMKVPCFVLNQQIIWGATAMILNEARYLMGNRNEWLPWRVNQ